MIVLRSEKNPIIKPEDVKPSRPDFKVVAVLVMLFLPVVLCMKKTL